MLLEGYPKNPDTIVIKNQFYPQGLTELNIYEYYQKNKKNILNQIRNRNPILFLNTNVNKTIVKRKIDNKFIELNSRTYDKIITGRTVSIHSSMHRNETFGIIDIDTNNFEKAKKIAAEVFDFIKISSSLLPEIRFTGKTSFHIIRYTKSEANIDYIRKVLKEILERKFTNKYNIAKTRKHGEVNLDISSNKYRGGFIFPGSLSILGLRCMIVSRNKILNFRREEAKI